MTWHLDPLVLLGVGLLAALYARGLSRARIAHPGARAAAFYAGLATVLMALVSPLAAMAHELFLAHMVQHLLLLMAAVPLALVGAPLSPLLLGLPAAVRAQAVRPLAGARAIHRVIGLLANPVVSLGVYVVVLSLWHLPTLYDAALESEPLHVLEHLCFVAIALLFWTQVIDPVPLRAALGYPLRIVYLFVATAHNTVLGGILSFAEPTLYAYYAARPERLFGIDPVSDQQWGGGIMWVPGGMVHLAAISLVFAAWLNAEERRGLESRPLPDSLTR